MKALTIMTNFFIAIGIVSLFYAFILWHVINTNENQMRKQDNKPKASRKTKQIRKEVDRLLELDEHEKLIS